MIYECLIAPSEQSYSINEIKKALLTYDKVKILDPADRDLMPSTIYNNAVMGWPTFAGVGGQAVRPMGKKIGYDEQFEKIIDKLKPAITQGLVEIISIYETPTKTDNNLTFFFGGVPRYEYPLPEQFVYDLYRGLAENQQLIQNIIAPNKYSLLEDLNLTDNLALVGIADATVNNGTKLPFLEDQSLTDTERGKLSCIARARIASLIKCSGFCEKKNIIPIFNGSTYGPLLTYAMNKSQETLSEIQDDHYWIRRNRILELCHEEFIDDALLDSLDINQTIKLRSSAWGENATRREALFSSIGEIALHSTGNEIFKKKGGEIIKKYRSDSETLCRERSKLKFNIKCNLTNAALNSGPAIAGLTGQISLGASFALTLLGATSWAVSFIKEHRQQIEIMKNQEKDMKRSACFGLHNFYSRI